MLTHINQNDENRTFGRLRSGAGKFWKISALTLPLVLAATTVFAQNRHVAIVNATSSNMVGFYASRVNVGDWQENMLHGGNIPPGNSLDANIDDGTNSCHYDLRAIFDDGSEATRANVNVCEAGAWTINGQ